MVMELSVEELGTLTPMGVLRESISIPRSSPRTFSLVTLTLVFPLSSAILAHTLFTHPVLLRLEHSKDGGPPREWALLFLYQFLYLLFLFTFSLLSTAAVVFTVASLYSSKPVSFSSTLSAIPLVFSRLFHTFLWVSALMTLYNLAFASAVLVLLLYPTPRSPLFAPLLTLFVLAFLAAHVFISSLWHLASVVTVLEPLGGLAAMRKSRELLSGRMGMAARFVLGYLGICGIIAVIFRMVVVRGGEEGSGGGEFLVGTKVLIGGLLVAALVLINLAGLLLQSVFYYVCKSFHHQAIDKSVLYDHLGGYLGEYVPLKSSIQMENL